MSDGGPTWDEKIAGVRRDYTALQSAISMEDVIRTLGDTATTIRGLPGEIEAIRQKGYVFAGYLEKKAEVLAQQWDEISQQVRAAVKVEINRIQAEFDQLGDLWPKLEKQWSDKGKEQLYNQIQQGVAEAKVAVENARQRINGMYGTVPENVGQTERQLRQIEGYLSLAAESTAEWGPTEALFLAVNAEWVQTGKGKKDPDGTLFLTDQRLIFEQNEKVGGRLGIGGEKVQQVLFETPVGVITEAQAEKKGLLGGKDLVHLKLSSGDFAELTLEVKGGVDCKWYVQQVNRVVNGEIENERAVPVDESVAEAVKNAPTVCPTCGATLPSIARGMTEMTCDYCGTVVRI
jgi:gas vesicle protein